MTAPLMPVFSLTAFLVLAGFYSLYSVSPRTEPAFKSNIVTRIQRYQALTRTFGAGLLLLALALQLLSEGIAAGVFTYFILLMTTGSLVTLLAPLKLVNSVSVPGTYGLIAFLEMMLF